MADERSGGVGYDDPDTAIIEIFSGEGFLSPGGREEVAEVLGAVDITKKTVLDFGCGTGGVDVALVQDHQAGRVVGVDVSKEAIARARKHASKHGLNDRLAFEITEPGSLPFDDAAFDIAFSSGVILLVPDKAAIFRELFRVIRPDGWLIVNDWYRSEGEFSPEMHAWIQMTGFEHMETLENTKKIVQKCGFTDVTTRERSGWYREEVDREIARLGEAYDRVVELVGEYEAQSWIYAGRLRKTAVHQGHIRPAHMHARKPSK